MSRMFSVRRDPLNTNIMFRLDFTSPSNSTPTLIGVIKNKYLATNFHRYLLERFDKCAFYLKSVRQFDFRESSLIHKVAYHLGLAVVVVGYFSDARKAYSFLEFLKQFCPDIKFFLFYGVQTPDMDKESTLF